MRKIRCRFDNTLLGIYNSFNSATTLCPLSLSLSLTMASFARGAASLTRVGLSSSKTPIQLIHRRGLAGAAGNFPHPILSLNSPLPVILFSFIQIRMIQFTFTLCILDDQIRNLWAVRFALSCASLTFLRKPRIRRCCEKHCWGNVI